MNNSPPPERRIAPKTLRAVLATAAVLLLIAAAMIALSFADIPGLLKAWNDHQLDTKLKNPANARYVAAIQTDRNELRRLATIETETRSKIGSFGTNAPEDRFLQKELQRQKQSRDEIQDRLDSNIKELK